MKTMLVFAAALLATQPLAAQSGAARVADSAAVRSVLSWEDYGAGMILASQTAEIAQMRRF